MTTTDSTKMTTAGGTSVGANRTTPAAAAATTMATARHQNSSSSSSSSSDQIEAKMHTALATVRKDRDTARRNYELAMERLTLLRTEVQTAERTVQERHTTLTQLQHDKQSLEGQITPLRQAVIQLKQEAEYQHAEVVTKQQKKNTMGNDMDTTNMKRQEQYTALEALIAKRRRQERDDHDPKEHHPPTPERFSPGLVQELLDELEDSDNTTNELVQLLPNLVVRKTNWYDAQTQQVEQDVLPRYQRILQGYQTKFGKRRTTTTTTDNNDHIHPHETAMTID